MDVARFEALVPKLTHQLGARELPFLASLLQEREVPAGVVLIEDHAPVNSLYLVAMGEFRVDVTGPSETLEIGRLRAGKWVGEISLFGDDHASTARVTATTPSVVLELPHEVFWSARTEHPLLINRLTKALVDLMSERMRSTQALINDSAQGDGAPGVPGQAKMAANKTWLKNVLQKLTGAEG